MKLLHIIATPRQYDSNTLRISHALIESLHSKYLDLVVDTIDLFNIDLPGIAGENIEAKYTLMEGKPVDKRHKESWKQIEMLIEHFLSADSYLVTVPMWNLSIPYALKYYIDSIVQPGYVFRYNEQGQVVPMVLGKKMICVTSRGGDYSASSPLHAYDFQEPYLRAIFGFIGIYDLHFINAQPMDMSPAMRQAAIVAAIKEANDLVANSDWPVSVTAPAA